MPAQPMFVVLPQPCTAAIGNAELNNRNDIVDLS